MNNTVKLVFKPIFFLVLAAIIILSIVIFFFFRSKNQPQVVNNYPVTTQQSPTSIPDDFNLATNGTQYKTETYTITYPKTWQTSVAQLNGSKYVIMESHEKSGVPQIVVEHYDASQSAIVQQTFSAIPGCTKGAVLVKSTQLAQVRCIASERIIDGNPVYTTTQLQMVFIPKPDAFYVVRFYYSSPQEIPTYESFFTQILSSFQIQ